MKSKITLFLSLLFLLAAFGLKAQVSPSFRWTGYASTTGNVYNTDKIVSLPDGSVFVAGSFQGESLTFGSVTIQGFTGGDGNSMFIARYNKDGSLMWAKSVYFSSLNWAQIVPEHVLLHTDLNPLLVFSGSGDTLYMPDGKIMKVPSGININVLMKIDLNTGNQTAVNYMYAEGGYLDFQGCDMDKDGNIVFVGNVNGDAFYLSKTSVDPVGLQGGNYYQSCLVKYDRNLNNPLWYNLWTVDNMAYQMSSTSVKIDPAGKNIVVAGYFNGTIRFDDQHSLTAASQNDMFIVGYDLDGNLVFNIAGQGDGDEYSGEVIFDTTGNCYITGASSSMQVTFGEHTVYGLSGGGIFDLFGLKLDKNILSQPSGSVVVKTMLNFYTPGYTLNKIKYIKDIDKIIWLTTFKSGTLVAGQLNLPKVTPVGAFSSPEYAALCLDPSSGQFLWGQNFGYNIDYETTFASFVNSSGVYFAVPLSNYYDLYLTGNKILSNNLEGSLGFAILYVTMDGRLAYVKSVLPEMPYDVFNLYGISLLRSGRVFVAGSYYSQSVLFLDGNILPITTGSYFFAAALGYGIQGTVYTPDHQPVTKGIVKLFGINTDTRGIELEKSDISGSGKYEFYSAPSSGFAIFAEPDPATYPNLLGTYFGDVNRWINVPLVDLSIAAAPVFDITLKERPTLVGTNSADGSVAFADNYLFDVAKRLKSIEGKPVKSASVVLVGRTKGDGENIIAQTYTDDYGFFTFSNVPDGSYTVIVDLPGYQHKQFFDFDVTGGQGVSGIHYLVTEEGIILRPLGINAASAHNFLIYPNPTSGAVKISTRQAGNYVVELYNLSGQKVKGTSLLLNEGESQMDLSGVAPGVYHVRISGNNIVFNAKLVIQ